MDDSFAAYRNGVSELLKRLNKEHTRYFDTLLYQHRLEENIVRAIRYGDTEASRAERAQIVDILNRLAFEVLGTSFNELCGLAAPEENAAAAVAQKPGTTYIVNVHGDTHSIAIGDQPQVESHFSPDFPHRTDSRGGVQTCHIIPLESDLPLEPPPGNLVVPPGYNYLGQVDGLTTHHFCRERDGQVVLWFQDMPGVQKGCLMDKYAITALQLSKCLNDLVKENLADTGKHGRSGIWSCTDFEGHTLVFDALDRWKIDSTVQEPWMHMASPWGLTYQNGYWEPVAGADLLPATLVSWWGARLYSLWAHDRLSLAAQIDATFLPTVKQWQAAALWDTSVCRQRRYPWGDTWRREWVNYAGYWADCEVREADWRQLWVTQAHVCRRTRPIPVPELANGRSPTGCVQMIGNVWEWCADNPVGSPSGSRAVKGGACLSPQEHCSPDWHVAWRPNQGSEYIGFRCCHPLTA